MSRPAGRRVWVVVLAVTAATAAVLGAVVAATLSVLADEPWTAGRAARQWALWSAVSAPVAFVFGGVAFAIARSVWRGRRGSGPG